MATEQKEKGGVFMNQEEYDHCERVFNIVIEREIIYPDLYGNDS